MRLDINPLILEELNKSQAHPAIKRLLRELIRLELQHASQQKWWYKQEYEPKITSALKEFTK